MRAISSARFVDRLDERRRFIAERVCESRRGDDRTACGSASTASISAMRNAVVWPARVVLTDGHTFRDRIVPRDLVDEDEGRLSPSIRLMASEPGAVRDSSSERTYS